ncbi:MAG: DUF2971 domain-containing protein [Gammaproteobacteria bacterium]
MKHKTGKNPNALYQYRPSSMWALDNLFCGVIYFRSPREFNDPYDCRTPPVLRDLTDKQLAFLRRTNPKIWGIPADNDFVPKGKFIAKVNKELRRRHKRVTEKCGVACFSRRNDNLLMWSHYAGGGRGFCLEFYDGNPALNLGYDVKYRKQFPVAYGYIKALAEGRETSQYTELLLTHKYREWEYEEEVRMFRGKSGKLAYPFESLKAVYLGTEATDCTKALIRAIAGEKYPHVALKECRLSEDECRVEFDDMR